jgi:hypothetical protein
MRSTFEADGYGSPSRPISEIAGQGGFSSVSHFNRLFRQRFGDSPMGSDMRRVCNWRDCGIVPLICPTCQSVFAVKYPCQRPLSFQGVPFFAWGCFRYFESGPFGGSNKKRTGIAARPQLGDRLAVLSRQPSMM